MEEELRAILLADTGVSNRVSTRINWGAHPQGQALPAIVLNLAAGAEGMNMNGTNNLFEGIVQVDCYADTYGSAKLLSRDAVSALHAYRGGGFRLVTQTSTRDSREGGTNEAERPYRVGLDFNIAWRAE